MKCKHNIDINSCAVCLMDRQPDKASKSSVMSCYAQVKEAFESGYELGHNDTVEGMYGDSEELAEYYIKDNVENIEDHYAYTCDCGSVHFNLLKSGGIECSGCGEKIKPRWHVPMNKEYVIPFCKGNRTCFSCRFFVHKDSFCQCFNASTESGKFCEYHQYDSKA